MSAKKAGKKQAKRYVRDVPAKRIRRKKTEPTAINLRMEGGLVTELDRWVDELNADGRYPQLSRVDLIRAILARAAKERWGAP